MRIIYALMNRRGKQMILLVQVNKITGTLIGTAGLASLAAFLIILSRPEIILGNKYLKIVYQALGFESSAYFLVFLSGILVLAIIFHQGYSIFSSYLQIRLSEGVTRYCLVMLYRYYLAESYEGHIQRDVSRTIGKSVLAVKRVVEKEINKLSTFLAALINAFVIFTGLYVLNAQAMLILTFMIMSGYVVFFIAYKNKAKRLGKASFGGEMKAVQLVREGVGGATEIKLMGKERTFMQEIHNALVGIAQRKVQQMVIGSIPQQAIKIASICGLYIIAVYVLINDSPEGAFTSLALFAVAIFRLLPSIENIFSMLIGQAIDATQFESVIEDLKLAKKSADEDKKDEEIFQVVHVRDKIVFDNVSYAYPDTDEPVIRGLNFSLPANKVIALFGRSGVGKTTLIRLLSGLLTPQKGRVLVDGRSLQDDIAFKRNWQKSSSFVLQPPFFMDTTLAMNIAFEATQDAVDYERVREAARLAQLEELIESLPNGVDTNLKENAEVLSGGQRQRIAIARALYRDASFLVLDEATNALDLVVEKKIFNALMGVKKNKVVIIIAHRPDTMRFADMVLVMKEDGTIVLGAYNELIERDLDFRSLAGAA